MPDDPIRNLAMDMTYIIARWELMINHQIIPNSFSYLTEEIYQKLTKYFSPKDVFTMVTDHTRDIGGYKNA